MAKKAIILDLDNTIYPVSSIGEKLFRGLFEVIQNSGEYSGDFESIKTEIMRTPFQKVAKAFAFSNKLYEACMQLLSNLTYDETMSPFPDYSELQFVKLPKFLVTVGFLNMQQSKVRQLGIEKDFEAIFIIDPEVSVLTKKDIFREIMKLESLNPEDLLIVGDDPESEIKAALELGIDAILYDPESKFDGSNELISMHSFRDLIKHI
jgi:putative hydrolase of the HAD superfamily